MSESDKDIPVFMVEPTTYEIPVSIVEPSIFVIGQHVPGWPGPLPQEGPLFNIDSGGMRLTLCLDNPTKVECEAFASGTLHFALVPGGEHTFFVMACIEGIMAGWIDAPFSLARVPEGFRDLPERAPNAGWLCTLKLIDNQTGILRGLRLCTVTPEFSTAMETLVEGQRQRLSEFALKTHLDEIAQVYGRCPTSQDMLPLAVIEEEGGIKFAHRFPEAT